MVILLSVIALLTLLTSSRASLAERDFIEEYLEEYRKIILNGDPDRGIPVLDPLLVEKYEFDVHDESISADISLTDLRIKGLGTFWVSKRLPITVLPIILNYLINVPMINGTAEYKAKGQSNLKGTNTSINADGLFTFGVENIGMTVKIKLTLPPAIKSVDVDLTMGEAHANIEGAGEVGEILNAHASDIIEKWFASWSPKVEEKTKDYIIALLEEHLRDI